MVIRTTRYEDDAKDNVHILQLWAKMLQDRFPKIYSIQITPGNPYRSMTIAVTNKKGNDVDVFTVEIHTESFLNYQRFKSKGRIAVQYYKKEKLKIHGDASILTTRADLFFHGFRNADPAGEATEILNPIFFWTGKLRRFVKQLDMIESTDPDIPPTYLAPNGKKVYDGFSISSWIPVTQIEINGGKVDMKWTMTSNGIIREKIFTIGILLPLKDVLDCATDDPFAPSLGSYSSS